MSLVTITFADPSQLAPLTARQDDVRDTVTRYLKREQPTVDAVHYDRAAGAGVVFADSAVVAAFSVAPLGGAA